LINMRYFLLALVVTLTSFALMTDDAEARRFGGGSSLGKQRYNYSRQVAPQQSPTAPAQQAMPNRPGQRTGGWFGPLAGLMAGGLLASLFLGHAFQGLQAMDLMVLAALGIGAFLLLRNRQRPAYSAGHGYTRTGLNVGEANFQMPEADSRLQEPTGAPLNRPDWFDEASFLRGAKTHFTRLQAAWDKGDMEDIREYTTPQLFAELTGERERLGLARHFTEVVQLKADLLDLATEGETVTASVRFSGLIREEESAVGEPFSEVWHVEHVLNDPQADWFVAGIQQE
jgi:predicted lipid-binding transport protein (Tim44 family)